jgi:hypothetical protein
MDHRRHAARGDLPCRFAAGEAAADDMDWGRHGRLAKRRRPAGQSAHENAREARALSLLPKVSVQSGSTLGIFPSDARDIGTADTDIRELAVTQTGQLLEAVSIGAPLAQKAEEV